MKLLDKQHAIDQGFKHYATGNPCKKCHTDKRTVNRDRCVQCQATYMIEWRAKSKKHTMEYDREYRKENPDKLKQWRRTYYQKHKDRILKNSTIYTENNPERRHYTLARYRCNNPKSSDYPSYGGRGIKFLFTSFQQWFEELGPKPSPAHTIDRIDPNGHYEPGNVRWLHRDKQSSNRRPFSEWRKSA